MSSSRGANYSFMGTTNSVITKAIKTYIQWKWHRRQVHVYFHRKDKTEHFFFELLWTLSGLLCLISIPLCRSFVFHLSCVSHHCSIAKIQISSTSKWCMSRFPTRHVHVCIRLHLCYSDFQSCDFSHTRKLS